MLQLVGGCLIFILPNSAEGPPDLFCGSILTTIIRDYVNRALKYISVADTV